METSTLLAFRVSLRLHESTDTPNRNEELENQETVYLTWNFVMRGFVRVFESVWLIVRT